MVKKILLGIVGASIFAAGHLANLEAENLLNFTSAQNLLEKSAYPAKMAT